MRLGTGVESRAGGWGGPKLRFLRVHMQTYPACHRTPLSPGKGYLNSLRTEQELGVSSPW